MQLKARQLASKLTLVYVIIAGSWIVFSDELVTLLIRNAQDRTLFSIFKGWFYVLLTGALLYKLCKRWVLKWEQEIEQRRLAEMAQKKALEQLRKSEEQLRLVMEASADGLWDWDLRSGASFLSSRYGEIVGEEGGTVASGRDALKQLVHPQDWPALEEAIDTHLAGKSPQCSNEFRISTKTGQTKWIWGRGRVVERAADGAPQRMVGTISDITRRKQAEEGWQESEERYKALFERSLECVFIADFEGKFLDANQAALTLLGYERKDINQLTFASLLTDDQVPLAFQLVEEILQSGHQNHPTEFQLRTRDGRIVFVEIQGSLIKREGKPFAIQGIARDITARKTAEEALRESEKRYRQLFELESDAIVLMDCETHRFVDVNLSAQQLYGYSREEFLNLKLEEVSAEPQEAVHCCESAHAPLLWHRKRNGERFAVEITTNRIEHQGRQTQLAAVRDITSRQQVMEMLRETTEQLTEAQRIAGIGSYVLNIKSGTWTCSTVMDEIFGITDAGCEKTVAGWLKIVHPLDRPEIKQYLEQILGDEKCFDRNYRIIRLDNQQERWVHGLGKLVRDERGEVVQMVGTIQDITRQKQSEEWSSRLATAVEQASEAIVITDTSGTILYANPAFEKSSGYTQAEALGRNPRMLKSGNQDAEFYRQLWTTIQRGGVWTGHFNNRRKDGTLYEEEATISPVRNGAGKIVNYVAVKRDVTRELQLEAQFHQAQKMEAIGTLAGGIAHDFNNILTAMFGNCYLLREDVNGNRQAQERVDDILNSATRAKDLVQQILTFSRKREQKRQVIPLDTVIKEAAKFLRASLPSHIKIELNLAADAPAVLADPTQIYQATMNLATNALHAMGDKPGHLTIGLDAFEPSEIFIQLHPEFQRLRYARLTVIDSGCGMDAKTVERIFEPFFTTKPIGQGTGLGLSVVHGVVTSHDGIVTVDSRPGEGTTFRLHFPGRRRAEVLNDESQTKVVRGNGEKILLVDDEVALTAVFQMLLKLLNYQATIHTDPRAAMAEFHQDPMQFDLVITDLTMPDMNGLELARQIRATRPDLPVVLLTGVRSKLGEGEAAGAGICELMEKPVSMTTLADTLQRCLP